MSGKSGRLTFSGRQEYSVVPVFGLVDFGPHGGFAAGVNAYAAICPCALGYHYLAIDRETGALVERTDTGDHKSYRWPTYAKAEAAIEAWQRQQQQRQAASSESEGE